MLSVIGLLRFALNIPENMVMSSETYEVIEREERKAFIDRHLLETEHIHKEIPFHRKEARLIESGEGEDFKRIGSR